MLPNNSLILPAHRLKYLFHSVHISDRKADKSASSAGSEGGFQMKHYQSTYARLCWSALILSLFLSGSIAAQSQAPAAQELGITFALIGDLGYRPSEEPLLQNVLDDLNKTSLAFIVHVGDLSSPSFACTNELLARRLAQFRTSAHPLVFTPGDNDWTDCHEGQRIKGTDPLERLANIRVMFFAGEQSLGRRTMPLVRQSQTSDPIYAKYRENVRWDSGGVTFVTLHIPGTTTVLGARPTAMPNIWSAIWPILRGLSKHSSTQRPARVEP